jgi:hypothetical protein
MSFNPTNQKDVVKILQYVSENSHGTPANYGVTPTASPSFIAAGINAEITLNPETVFENIMDMGNYDLANQVKIGEVHGFVLRSKIVDSTLAKYGFNLPAGAGTAADSLSFIYSKNINGTENYTFMKGCKPLSSTLSLDRDAWNLEMTWICKDITLEATSHGLTTPTFVTTPSTSPWTHVGLAASPFTWNSINYEHRRFSTTCTFDMSVIDTNGNVNIVYAKVATRRCTLSADVWKKSDAIRIDHDGGTLRSSTMSVNSAGSSSLTYANANLTSWSERHVAGGSDALAESITAEARTVTLT